MLRNCLVAGGSVALVKMELDISLYKAWLPLPGGLDLDVGWGFQKRLSKNTTKVPKY